LARVTKKPSFVYDLKTYPKNAEQWWNLLEQTWEQLLPILTEFLGSDKITIVSDYKNSRDGKLVELLEICYSKVPMVDCQRIIGWSILCELLSESDVLHLDHVSDKIEF